MKILLLDNYDSFTYNLFHLISQFDGVEVDVFRNDEIEIDDIGKYDRIIISPGPGIPSEAGITSEVIRKYFSLKPILGVCLGMQAIAEVAGGRIFNLKKVYHGVSTKVIITDKEDGIFKGIPSTFLAGRYHSWCVEEKSLPTTFKITSKDEEGNIMSLTHEGQMVRGVQFHPESILTEFGKVLMSNWLLHC